MAIRGDSDTEGNLFHLLSLRGEDDPPLKKWLQQQQYMSHDVSNEIITLLGNALLQELLSRIREGTWFAILADETTDISNNEQLSVSIRWVNKLYEVGEDFIGLVHVPSITASVLTVAIKDILLRCSLPLVQCRGQGYDGAANMMGHLRGVASQYNLKRKEQFLFIVLRIVLMCLQDSAKKCEPIRNSLDIVIEICKLVMNSPKRLLVFQECKEELHHPGTGLRPLCPTRWTVRNVAIDAVLRNYCALLQAFERISAESHDDYGRRANGILTMLDKFSVYLGLKHSFLVFGATEQVSRTLQARDTTLQEALVAVNTGKLFLQRQRDDCAFERFYVNAETEAKQYNIEPVLPCYRRPPKRLDDDASPHVDKTPQDYYRRQYFEVLDLYTKW